MWQLLDHPHLWETNGTLLDAAFGLYRRRIELMRAWGVLQGSPSVLDVGCGTGRYAQISSGEDLGVDGNVQYIQYAMRRRGPPHGESSDAQM